MEIILGLAVGFVFAVLIFLLWQFIGRTPKGKEGESLLLIQNQINEITRTLDAKLGEIPKVLQIQFGESAKIIKEITSELVKVSEGQKQVSNVADQLKNLQDILKNPKQRGVLGEYYLEAVLKNVMPPGGYEMQYKFKDGTAVDAVIFVRDRIIPIDSKFSLENYNRLIQTNNDGEKKRLEELFRQDLKTRIDETSKYIKPEEGTMEFSFMFIPSEAIYYDLLINKVGSVEAKDLIQYAAEKRVIVVSPTSFLAYLQTVLQGLKALQIEESAKEIRKRVEELGRHLGGFEVHMKKLGGHLGTSISMYNQAYKELGKIDKDVLRISDKSAGIEPMELEKPEVDERD
jgi:DNA recombination protein RmuC